MSIEANKNVVRSFFKALEAGDVERAASLVSGDVQWWVQGTGICDKPRLVEVWNGLFAAMSTTRAMHIVGMIAEEDGVAVEIESDIRLRDGRDFRNTFHIAFVIESGKISKAREYFDTAYVQRMFSASS